MPGSTGAVSATMTALESAWYGRPRWSLLLFPLSLLYGLAVGIKRLLYRIGLLQVVESAVPVIVVGNLTVGGTGKTPVVIALVRMLRARGLRPGIVSRGYGGNAPRYPLTVDADSDPAQCGDEPAMLARRLGVPVVVDPDRVRAVQSLASRGDVDVVVSDDGLQHLRMGRVLELVVMDAARGLGNGWLLPVGPLRESASRLKSVDMVLVHGGGAAEASFRLRLGDTQDLYAGARQPLAAFAGKTVQAVAGIGHPERFFNQLTKLGLHVIPHPFPDHHRYTEQDFRALPAGPVLLTEKDAIKCRSFAAELGPGRLWVVPAEIEFNPVAQAETDRLLARVLNHG